MIIPDVKFQSRFKAFMDYKGLSIGDSYKGYEFILFIQSNLRNFLSTKDLHTHYPLNDQLHDEFTKYLFSLNPKKSQ